MTMAMEEARLYCQKRHSDLITLTSEAESVFLWKQVSSFSYGIVKHSEYTAIKVLILHCASVCAQLFRSGAMFYWIGLKVDLDGTYG